MRCTTGKICHATQGQAEEELIRIVSEYPADHQGAPNGYYQCISCGQFHLTSRSTDTSFIETPKIQQLIRLKRQANRWGDT